MQREEVQSSNIKSVGYNPIRRKLEIEFKSGDVYRYKSVPRNVHHQMMSSKSKGSFLHHHIKFQYPYRKYQGKDGDFVKGEWKTLPKPAKKTAFDDRFKEYIEKLASGGNRIYHLSEKNLDGVTIHPRVPDNSLTKGGFEDSETPRISFSTSVGGALTGISNNLSGKTFYIHVPETTVEHYKPTVGEVPDVRHSHEVWVQEPVKLKLHKKIVVTSAQDKPLKYVYGDKDAETYKWNYDYVPVAEKKAFDLVNELFEKLARTKFTEDQAKLALKKLDIDVSKEKWTLADFLDGMNVELEHGTIKSPTNITDDDLILTAKIALAHLNEHPGYYPALDKMEAELSKKEKKSFDEGFDDYIEKVASLDAVRKKQYWQLLKKMYGGADRAVNAVGKSGDSGIYHATESENIPNILSSSLKSHPAMEFGEGTFFSSNNPNDVASNYMNSASGDKGLLRLKKPSELSDTGILYPKTNQAMTFDSLGAAHMDRYQDFKDRHLKSKVADRYIGYLKKRVSSDNPQEVGDTWKLLDTARGDEEYGFSSSADGIQRLMKKSPESRQRLIDNNRDSIMEHKIMHPTAPGVQRDMQFNGMRKGQPIMRGDRNEFHFYKTDVPGDILKQAALNDDVRLYPHQQRIVDSPETSKIIAHSVGGGKTLTAIAKFEKMKQDGKATHALVVVPAGLRENFHEKGVKQFTNSKSNIVGTKQEMKSKLYGDIDPNADYNIMSYEMYRKDPARAIMMAHADTVIADEAHKGKNEGTLTTEQLKKYRPLYKNHISLTGSLVSNSVADVQPLVDLVSGGKAHVGKSKDEFERMYVMRNNSKKYQDVKEKRRPIVGFKNPHVLGPELTKYIDYADYDDLKHVADMPDKKIAVKKVPISKQQAKMYKKMLHDDPAMMKLIKEKRLETLKSDEIASAFNKLIEERKLMNSVGSVVPGISLSESANITPKTKALLDNVDNHLKTTPDGEVILMSHLINGGTDVLEQGLKDRHIEYGTFLGKGNKGVTEASRQQAVRDYNDHKKRVMIISDAGGEGLSLDDTTYEAVLDPHFNPERMKQMEARGIRSGGLKGRADRTVRVDRYLATMPKTFGLFKSNIKTPDEFIYELQANKEEQNQKLYQLLRQYE